MSLRRYVCVCATVALLVGAPGTAFAQPAPPPEPPQYQAIPPQIPQAIDAAIPPPPPDADTSMPIVDAARLDPQIARLRASVLPSPTGDSFFDIWPSNLGTLTPGDIITERDVTAAAAILVTAPVTRIRQVKFRTDDVGGNPMIGTATLIEPTTPWRGGGPRPILVNNLPIDSLGEACTPSYSLAHGFNIATNPTDLLPPTTQLAAANGYAVLIPDHEGPRMAYAEPVVAAHVVLDSIRAVARVEPALYGKSRVAMSGYSGGAIATAGAAKLVATYAPELQPRLVGVAIGGVPADFHMLIGSMNANLATGLLHAATLGVARERTEMLPMMNNAARWLASSPLKNGCTIPLAAMGGTFMPMQLMANDPDPFHSPVAEHVFAATKLADKKVGTPIYIYNGAQEFWVPAAGARNLYNEQCALGANAAYREVLGEHGIAALTGLPEALTWLDQRLHGQPAPNECG
ncbi:lipase family protein [Antrihabitans cavernicola]|uniref:Lipase n=1 Tax=Antrihabitans cavernicola TaxID=2495913 RepID=A0A5A7SEK2_9NOCA|nr:lipase family protein [Spelaeibacter cavernicola]KAA0024528.1 lipase [Spelaeibacter cavernicola]